MKTVLAYSGGLDTSFCIKYLTQEKGMEVHAVSVNTGGFSGSDLPKMKENALSLGAASFECLARTEAFYEEAIKYLIFGNVLKGNTYPLSVSAERIFQAVAIAEYAKKVGADAIAHGSTGAGNDQVRFDLAFTILCPEMQIITPIRDMQLSRQAEVEYLQKHGVELSWEKAQYSINKGLWGTSVGGAETLTSHQPLPDSAYPTPLQKEAPETISLQFEKGEPVGLNGEKRSPLQTIEALEQLAAPFAIGRDIHVGDTIIGIKGRVGFEAAAPLIVIKAHHLLEKHTLSKWQQHWKEQLGNWYGMLLHEGQFLEPVMRNIETFLADTQPRVSGTVHVQLSPYRFDLLGIESSFDLMDAKFGSYGEMNTGWTGEDVKGFTKVLANATQIYHRVGEGE